MSKIVPHSRSIVPAKRHEERFEAMSAHLETG
jgi:hypothetical protein